MWPGADIAPCNWSGLPVAPGEALIAFITPALTPRSGALSTQQDRHHPPTLRMAGEPYGEAPVFNGVRDWASNTPGGTVLMAAPARIEASKASPRSR
jgi:hypothetical protein